MHFLPPTLLWVVFGVSITAALLAGRLESPGAKAPDSWLEGVIPLFMQVTISLILLVTCLYIILSGKYTTSDQHWAYGTIGTVTGFWLKGSMVSSGRKKK